MVNVLCQHRAWWSQTVRNKRGGNSALPVELQDVVFDAIDGFPITLEEAKGLRCELMKERKWFVVVHGEAFEEREFSLCEH